MFLKKSKNWFLISVCCFYIGFVGGNLFGTILNFLRAQFVWDGAILILIILGFELINFLIYKQKGLNNKIVLIFQNVQIGALLGFFIDAFKVGS